MRERKIKRQEREKRNIEKEESERERERNRETYVYEGLSRYVFLQNRLVNVIFQNKTT